MKGNVSHCAGERAALKRVRASGPETRLTGHSAKLLTQDTHCLRCQLPGTHFLILSLFQLVLGGRWVRGGAVLAATSCVWSHPPLLAGGGPGQQECGEYPRSTRSALGNPWVKPGGSSAGVDGPGWALCWDKGSAAGEQPLRGPVSPGSGSRCFLKKVPAFLRVACVRRAELCGVSPHVEDVIQENCLRTPTARGNHSVCGWCGSLLKIPAAVYLFHGLVQSP